MAGQSNENWRENAKAEIFEILKEVAAKGETITYGELVRHLTSADLEPNGTPLRNILGEISEETYQAFGHMLSAVVINESDNFPGDGFFTAIPGLNVDWDYREAFWIEQLNEAENYWSSNFKKRPSQKKPARKKVARKKLARKKQTSTDKPQDDSLPDPVELDAPIDKDFLQSDEARQFEEIVNDKARWAKEFPTGYLAQFHPVVGLAIAFSLMADVMKTIEVVAPIDSRAIQAGITELLESINGVFGFDFEYARSVVSKANLSSSEFDLNSIPYLHNKLEALYDGRRTSMSLSIHQAGRVLVAFVELCDTTIRYDAFRKVAISSEEEFEDAIDSIVPQRNSFGNKLADFFSQLRSFYGQVGASLAIRFEALKSEKADLITFHANSASARERKYQKLFVGAVRKVLHAWIRYRYPEQALVELVLPNPSLTQTTVLSDRNWKEYISLLRSEVDKVVAARTDSSNSIDETSEPKAQSEGGGASIIPPRKTTLSRGSGDGFGGGDGGNEEFWGDGAELLRKLQERENSLKSQSGEIADALEKLRRLESLVESKQKELQSIDDRMVEFQKGLNSKQDGVEGKVTLALKDAVEKFGKAESRLKKITAHEATDVLSKSFERERSESRDRAFWWFFAAIFAFALVGAAVGVATGLLWQGNGDQALDPYVFWGTRISIPLPFVVLAAWITARYSKERRLFAEYAHKTIAAQTLLAYKDLVEDELLRAKSAEEKASSDFLISTVKDVLQSPVESVFGVDKRAASSPARAVKDISEAIAPLLEIVQGKAGKKGE